MHISLFVVYVCACVCTHTYVYIYMYMYTCTYTCTYTHIYKHIHIYIYILYIYIYTQTFVPCTWTKTAMDTQNPQTLRNRDRNKHSSEKHSTQTHNMHTLKDHILQFKQHCECIHARCSHNVGWETHDCRLQTCARATVILRTWAAP